MEGRLDSIYIYICVLFHDGWKLTLFLKVGYDIEDSYEAEMCLFDNLILRRT